MNKNILVLDENEMYPASSVLDRSDYYVRHAVRAVFCDAAGRVALMYAGLRDYYKLPGGGINDGEEIADALKRELMEETGSAATINRFLGTVIEWRNVNKMHQISHAYSATLLGESGPPGFTQSELNEGFEVRWAADIKEAIALVESKQTHDDLNVVFMVKRDAAILRAAQ